MRYTFLTIILFYIFLKIKAAISSLSAAPLSVSVFLLSSFHPKNRRNLFHRNKCFDKLSMAAYLRSCITKSICTSIGFI